MLNSPRNRSQHTDLNTNSSMKESVRKNKGNGNINEGKKIVNNTWHTVHSTQDIGLRA